MITAILAFARSEAVLLVSMAVIAGGVFAFVNIAGEVSEGDARAFDWAVLQYFHPDQANPSDPVGPKWLDHAVGDFSALGSVTVLMSVVIVAGGFLLLRRREVEAGLPVLAMGGGLAISQSLKAVFERARPPDIYRSVEVLNESFPSGHAMLSAVVYLTLGAMLARATTQNHLRGYVMGAAILITLLVGLTRIYLGAHWASDVLAGWCAGAAWATACWLLDRWARRRLSPS
jgi:undecaprenyl-diphosphatase